MVIFDKRSDNALPQPAPKDPLSAHSRARCLELAKHLQAARSITALDVVVCNLVELLEQVDPVADFEPNDNLKAALNWNQWP